MKLSELTIKPSYTKTDDDIAEEFYLPCMRNSNAYDRISGYFGSTIYIIAWDALKEFIENGGHMRLICSPYISDDDEKAMAKGYSARHDELLADSLRTEMENLFSQSDLSAPSTLLAYMVSEDIIDIRIAAIDTGMVAADVRRLFHDKVGIFEDAFGNAVGFRGSMNETFKGLSSDGNIESIDAFPNWLEERDYEHVVALSLIGALHQNAPLSGPIIMDSPFGRLDPGHKTKIASALPSMSNEVILLAYTSEIDEQEARERLGSALNHEYRLTRHSSFNTQIERQN